MLDKIVYLDNNATTQCDPEVIAAMLPFFGGDYGNPSSPHIFGRRASLAVESARQNVAECVGCDPSEVYFTSGATEANNAVILSFSRQRCRRRRIVTSVTEHKSVLAPCEVAEQAGYDVVFVPSKPTGEIDLVALRTAVNADTVLVSVQAANNETGVIQPAGAIAEIAHAEGAAFHCDAAQMLGKLPVSMAELGADFATFSAHKAYGPKGVGFLVARRPARDLLLAPLMLGGGQENGLRSGTLNVPGIVGTGESCRLCTRKVGTDMGQTSDLRRQLEQGMLSLLPGARIVGSPDGRLPGTVSILLPDIPADLLIASTPTVCMSLGSACMSGAVGPSHVLLAVGLSREEARCVVRFSLGRFNTAQDVTTALSAIRNSLEHIGCQGKGSDRLITASRVADREVR